MTKAMIASSFAAIVDEGKINWNSQLSELVPEFRTAGATNTHRAICRRVHETWTTHANITSDSGYGLGWVLTQLPTKAGLVGINGYECPELPTIARGSVSGALSAVHLLPEMHSTIVVLVNPFDLCDIPDCISQLLLETLLDAPEQNEFVQLARETSANALSHHPPTIERLAKEQIKGTKAPPLEEYYGRSYNELGNFFLLDIMQYEYGLRMSPQGFQDSSYTLHHYLARARWRCRAVQLAN